MDLQLVSHRHSACEWFQQSYDRDCISACLHAEECQWHNFLEKEAGHECHEWLRSQENHLVAGICHGKLFSHNRYDLLYNSCGRSGKNDVINIKKKISSVLSEALYKERRLCAVVNETNFGDMSHKSMMHYYKMSLMQHFVSNT